MFPGQALPQPPQWAASYPVSSQCPEQQVLILTQWPSQAPQLSSSVFRFLQTPLQQVSPAAQALPQLPQWAVSVSRVMQTVPHWVKPAVQPQAPPTFLKFPGQAQTPFSQFPPTGAVHDVPSCFGWHVRFLQRFLPFFLVHLPFVQVVHSVHAGWHVRDFRFPSVSTAWRSPKTPPRSALSVRRRVIWKPNALVRASNWVSSTKASWREGENAVANLMETGSAIASQRAPVRQEHVSPVSITGSLIGSARE